jgi:hypothetical protein
LATSSHHKPRTHTSVWGRNIHDYYIELRNRSADRTISDVIVTWDETPFTRFIDEKLSRDWLLSPTSIAPSSSVSILLFSLEDDLRTVKNRKDVLGLTSTFAVRASAKGMGELIARFRYEPDKIPKLRRLKKNGGIRWRYSTLRLLCAPFPFSNRAGGEPTEFGGSGVEFLGVAGAPRLECGEPAAEAGELIRRQLGNGFGDFFDFHVVQYSTAEA